MERNRIATVHIEKVASEPEPAVEREPEGVSQVVGN
jgi:hypothetical protein